MLILSLSGFLFGLVFFFVTKNLIINLLKPLKEQLDRVLLEQDVVRGQHNVMLESINTLLVRYGEQVRHLILIKDKIETNQSALNSLKLILLKQGNQLESISSLNDKMLSGTGLALTSDIKELEKFITKSIERDFSDFLKPRTAGEIITIGGIYNAKVVSNSSKSIVLRIPHPSDIQPSKET